ncbi:hypothetical protein HPB50_023747 [Hyalomma asiaticum]|uniref:Uncharacterized protein n=1 Tax=Hyalomma asiaticum TaxID=266040 RepID=A0ACB7T3Z9_HYAAI|nr:hypothetical protein HPB50_023747 [Hyalomma asiaticum]
MSNISKHYATLVLLVAPTVAAVSATSRSSDAATGEQAASIDCLVDSAVTQELSSSWTTASNTCLQAVYWLPTVFIRVSKVSLSWPATFVNFATRAPTTKCHCRVNSRRAAPHMLLRRLLRGGATLNPLQTPKTAPQFLAVGTFVRKVHRPLRPIGSPLPFPKEARSRQRYQLTTNAW